MKKLTWKALTARNNTAFLKKTNAEKRVAIARDVLKILAAKLIKTAHCYITFKGKDKLVEENPSGSIKESMGKFPTCYVCAKGAIFLATVAKRNQVPNFDLISSIWDGPTLTNKLGKIFSASQLNLIERCYERTDHEYDDDQLIQIMRNIIRNKGTFKPSQDKLFFAKSNGKY